MEGPVTPVIVTVKSETATPDTAALKVTVNWTLAALVGLAFARSMDETAGAVTVKLVEAELRKASCASTVFCPIVRRGTVIPHANEPFPSDIHWLVKTRLMPL